MKAGQFNINEYLEKLYEEAGDGNLSNKEGIIIPDENKKSYDWLKKEYEKGKTEVKVEISMGGAKFEPGYDLQTNLDSVKDFKPGMFGEVKTKENPNPNKPASLDTTKEKGSFAKGEGDGEKKPLPGKEGEEKKVLPKTNAPKGDIKNKEHQKHEAGESKEKEEKEEHEAGESEEEEEKEEKSKGEKPEVKKIDLKTKK